MEKFDYKKYVLIRDEYRLKVNNIASMRMIIFILMIASFIMGSKNNFFNILGVFLVIIFIVFIFVHDKYYKLLDYYDKYVKVLDQYKDRMSDKWKKFDDKGYEYSNELFDDLNIVGDNSLFQYLSVCKTLSGRYKLISKLSNKKISVKELKDSQKVMEELNNNIEFDINFQINMLEYEGKKINLESGFDYLDKSVGKRYIDFAIGIIFSGGCLLLLLLGYLGIISYNYFYGLFVFNFLINYMYSFIYRDEFESITKVSSLYGRLQNVYKCIIGENFKCSKLKKMSATIENSYDSVKRLVFIDDLNNLKNNILSSFIFNGLFCINIMVMFMYSLFLNRDTDELKKGIKDISELEAMISLAGIGLIRDDVCMPSISDELCLDFSNIKHPLIDRDVCVGNDFKGKDGVNIITGSNMGGKTSFIRTIGVNLILMNAGTYVCADSFKGCYLKVFTSIGVGDDIDKGISTFYGELLRIKKAIDYQDGNRIILVDEIFKGTNYNDRIYGAVNVIKKLNDKRSILFITTHDFELCDTDTKNLENYYVKEFYEGDNIKFDYKVRKGKCTSTNAKYLMKKLDII